MKKLILAFAVITLTAATVNAQDKEMAGKKTTFGIAANGGIPTSNSYTIVFGFDVQADIAASENLKITASAGYENYSIKTALGGGHQSYLPLLAGVKFNFSPQFYGHGQLGYAVGAQSGLLGAFAYAPSIGYNFSPNLDVSLKYLGLSRSGSSLGALLARLAYSF